MPAEVNRIVHPVTANVVATNDQVTVSVKVTDGSLGSYWLSQPGESDIPFTDAQIDLAIMTLTEARDAARTEANLQQQEAQNP